MNNVLEILDIFSLLISFTYLLYITVIDQELYYAIMRKVLNGMSIISFIVG